MTLPKDVKFGEGVQLKNITLPEGFIVPDGAVLDNVTLPKDVKLGEGVQLKNMTVDGVSLPKSVKLGGGIQLKSITIDGIELPKDVKLGWGVHLENMPLPEGFAVPDGVVLDNVTLPKDVKLDEGVQLKNMTLPEGAVVPDKALLDNVTLPKDVKLGEGVQLKNMTVDGVSLPKSIKFYEGVQIKNVTLPEGIFVSAKSVLDNVTLPKDVQLGEGVQLKNMTLPEGVKVPDEVVFDNVTLPKDVELGEGVQLKNMTVDGVSLPDKDVYCDNVVFKNTTLGQNLKGEGVKIGDGVIIDNQRAFFRFGDFQILDGANIVVEGSRLPDNLSFRNVSSLKLTNEDFSLPKDYSVLPPAEKIEINSKLCSVSTAEDLEFISKCKLDGLKFIECKGELSRGTKIPSGVMVLAGASDNDMTIVLPEGKNLRQALSDAMPMSDSQIEEFERELRQNNAKIYTAEEFSGVKAAEKVTQKTEQKVAPVKEMADETKDKLEQRVSGATIEQKVAPVKEMAAESMDKLEQKLAAKGGTKTAALTAEQIAEQAAKQAGILAQAAAANAKFDRAVDAAIDGGAEILNETLLGRAYDKAEKAVSNTKVAKAVGKTAEKAGQAVAKTAVGKAVTKTVAKTAGSAVGKSVLKKIPLVSLGAGAYFAWQRLKDGDWKGACGEVASGALGCLPGLGTAASTAIDVGLAARDISGVVNENGEAAIEQKGELTAAARPAKVSAEMKAEIAARGEVKKSEFKAAARPLTAEKATLFKKSREY